MSKPIPPAPNRCDAHEGDGGPWPLDCRTCLRRFDRWQSSFCTPRWRVALRRVRALRIRSSRGRSGMSTDAGMTEDFRCWLHEELSQQAFWGTLAFDAGHWTIGEDDEGRIVLTDASGQRVLIDIRLSTVHTGLPAVTG
jgi:hypothetical protein